MEQQKKDNINVSWIFQPNKKGGLAISNLKFIQSADLASLNIGAIISIIGEKQFTLPSSIKHFRILISDNPTQNIKCFFSTSYTFIDSHISNTNVVVHCQAGVSRSATLVIAYLMKKKSITLQQAFSTVKSKRVFIEPNKGFMKQLRMYEKQLNEQKKCQIY